MRIKCPMTKESICEDDLIQFIVNFILNLEKEDITSQRDTDCLLVYLGEWIKKQKELNGIKKEE